MPASFHPGSFDIGAFDLDITLTDAALDEANRPTRRMLANACIGIDPFDAYYASLELFETLEADHEECAGAKAKLARILLTRCDDFQWCLYYSLAARGVVQMLADLEWLLHILSGRVKMSAELLRHGGKVETARPPYIGDEPDGPIAAASPDFELGASWFLDPDLGGRLSE
ncbi:hypothetical protein KCG44_04960 [Pacificimonas sp. WHA3]|uniref:Uncharacterized protein n=1 Tax=Pacificimonas pallii TaxID=2827236 RepID=A0ABS6SCI8_9SPHN|nr:hypothetical protein [Pacificimonas pallii]MBV7256130.1 hypothetical protein [Pacificimonas pallii]